MANTLKVQFLTKQAEAKMKAIIDAGTSQAAFASIGRVLVNRIRLCFKFGIDPWNSPWAKLKIRKGQPLVDRGRMRSSIKAKADNSGVTVGTNLIQARIHQFGGEILPKKGPHLVFPGPGGRLVFAKRVFIPARPYLPIKAGAAGVALPVSWSLDVVRALRKYFLSVVNKEGA